MSRLDGKVAIVTGASRGIGRATAVELAAEGASVAVVARDGAALKALAGEIEGRGGQVLAQVCDVTDRTRVDALVAATVARFGALHVLVNAAQAPAAVGVLQDYPIEALERAFRSGLQGSLNVMQASFPHLKAAGESSIVNFGDPDAVVGEPGKLGMNVTKEAIRALTRTAAREWGRYGIRVNVVDPTALSERVSDDIERQPDLKAWIESQMPGGRIGAPRDVARAIVFLASRDSGMLTGMTVEVDGGRGMFA